MTISPLLAAKYLGHFSGWNLTNLHMQKVLYIAHMLHMFRHNGEPLVSELFEAWDYGPVLPSLYHKAKAYGNSPVRDIFHGELDLDSDEANSIRETHEFLLGATAGQLVSLTHKDGGAWSQYYSSGVKGVKIPNAEILEEFERHGNAQ